MYVCLCISDCCLDLRRKRTFKLHQNLTERTWFSGQSACLASTKLWVLSPEPKKNWGYSWKTEAGGPLWVGGQPEKLFKQEVKLEPLWVSGAASQRVEWLPNTWEALGLAPSKYEPGFFPSTPHAVGDGGRIRDSWSLLLDTKIEAVSKNPLKHTHKPNKQLLMVGMTQPPSDTPDFGGFSRRPGFQTLVTSSLIATPSHVSS